MKYLIKYGLMVALLVSIAMNIVEPSTEHKLLQAIIAIGFLMFLYIEWSMGKTGVLTPIALFEPIDIDGSIITRASLHNINTMGKIYKKLLQEIKNVPKDNEKTSTPSSNDDF